MQKMRIKAFEWHDARDPKIDFLECSELTINTCVYRYITCHCYWTSNTWNCTLHLHTVENTEGERPWGIFNSSILSSGHQCHSWLLEMSAQSCHPILGAEPSASPHSPLRNQETVSSSIYWNCQCITLISFNNGDIFIDLFHHPPQNPKCFTDEEISASACALLLSMMKKTKLVFLGIVHSSHIQLLYSQRRQKNFSLINY